MVDDAAICDFGQGGTCMVSDAEQQAAAFFELADNIDSLGRGAGFRQNDCHSVRTKRLQNRLPGVLHAETELAHIGKIAGPIFAERTGRADPDKNDLPGLLQHTASVVDALPKGGRVDIKEKVLDSRFAAVYKILALLFQITGWIMSLFPVLLATQPSCLLRQSGSAQSPVNGIRPHTGSSPSFG